MPAIDQLQLNDLISKAVKENASAVYFNISNYPALEIYGNLRLLKDRPILTKDFLDTIAENFLNDHQKKILEEKKELTIGYNFSENIRIVINFFYQQDSLSVNIKFIPNILKDIKDLGLPQIIDRILDLNSGLVIVCGPVGSGRSTTVLSILQYINKNQEKRIVTIEEPIEFQFINEKSIIQQREVNRDVDSVYRGLKDIIDENFDVVYVSKINASEEINLMLQVAASGKLVFVVMDSDSIASLLDKMFASFDISEKEWGKGLISESLKVVINQRLLSRNGGGQILASEVFTMSSSGKSIVKLGKFDQLKSLIQTSRHDNMQDLESSIKILLQKGLVKPEEAKKYLFDNNL